MGNQKRALKRRPLAQRVQTRQDAATTRIQRAKPTEETAPAPPSASNAASSNHSTISNSQRETRAKTRQARDAAAARIQHAEPTEETTPAPPSASDVAPSNPSTTSNSQLGTRSKARTKKSTAQPTPPAVPPASASSAPKVPSKRTSVARNRTASRQTSRPIALAHSPIAEDTDGECGGIADPSQLEQAVLGVLEDVDGSDIEENKDNEDDGNSEWEDDYDPWMPPQGTLPVPREASPEPPAPAHVVSAIEYEIPATGRVKTMLIPADLPIAKHKEAIAATMGIKTDDLEVAWKLNTMPKNSSPVELVSTAVDLETEVRAFGKMESAVKAARAKEDKKQADWESKVKRGKVDANTKSPEKKVVVVIISDIRSPQARKLPASVPTGTSNIPTLAAGAAATGPNGQPGTAGATFLPQARSAYPCALDRRAICIGVGPTGRHDHLTHSESSRWEMLWRQDPTKYSPLQVPDCIRSSALDSAPKPRRHPTKAPTPSTSTFTVSSQEPPTSRPSSLPETSPAFPHSTIPPPASFPGAATSPPAYAVQAAFPSGFEYFGMTPMMFPSPFGYPSAPGGGFGMPVPTSPGDLEDEIDYPRVSEWLRTQVDGTRREQDGQNFAQWGDAIEEGGYLRINSLHDPARVRPEDIVNVVADASQVIPKGYASCLLKWVEEDVKRMKREAIAARRKRT